MRCETDRRGDIVLEKWRPVVGFEGYYSVSSLGRVRRDRAGQGARRGHVLKQIPRGDLNKDGRSYLGVTLCRDGLRTGHYVHELAATAFLGARPDEQQVNHKDSDPGNNRVANLERSTPSGNIAHAVATGRVSLGEDNANAKLSNEAVETIRSSQGVSQQTLADRFDCSQSLVSKIRSGKNRRQG